MKCKKNYELFFEDLVSELKKFGKLRFVHVCSNAVPHLRGNVYAVWETRDEGARALQNLQGRYYAGRQLEVEYLPESVISWYNGICNDYLHNACTRGKDCSYFHFYV